MRRTELTIDQILGWADAYVERKGKWPTKASGRLWEPADEKWLNIDSALRAGLRGLRRGQSLAILLAKHRGVRNRKSLPPFSVTQILKWADAHRARTGKWPRRADGLIPGTKGETWNAVEIALNHGQRGMPGGTSLVKLLAAKRCVKNSQVRPKLTVPQILHWIDEHRTRTGIWPTYESGLIRGTDDTWLAIDKALRAGRRGLRRSSLARLLRAHRGVPLGQIRRPPLTIRQILAWGDAAHAQTGKWPTSSTGRVQDSPGESWNGIQRALQHGTRGLPGGMSLGKLWTEHRGVRIHLSLPPLTEKQIAQWAQAHKRATGRFPSRDSGPIPKSGGETWCSVVMALRKVGRGLKRSTTLRKLIAEYC